MTRRLVGPVCRFLLRNRFRFFRNPGRGGLKKGSDLIVRKSKLVTKFEPVPLPVLQKFTFLGKVSDESGRVLLPGVRVALVAGPDEPIELCRQTLHRC